MYNGSIVGMPHRINDEVEEREIIRKGLSSRQARLCGGERGIDKVKEWDLQEPVSTRAPRYKKLILKKRHKNNCV